MDAEGSKRKPAWPDDGVTDEMIARRAFELARSDPARSELENWFLAAAQLRAEQASRSEAAARS